MDHAELSAIEAEARHAQGYAALVALERRLVEGDSANDLSTETWMLVGHLRDRRAEWHLAAQAFHEALRRQPDQLDAAYHLATTSIDAGSEASARQILLDYLVPKLPHGSARRCLGISRIANALGEHGVAMRALEQAGQREILSAQADMQRRLERAQRLAALGGVIWSLGENCFPWIFANRWGLRAQPTLVGAHGPMDLGQTNSERTARLVRGRFADLTDARALSIDIPSDGATPSPVHAGLGYSFNHEQGPHWTEQNFAALIERYEARRLQLLEACATDIPVLLHYSEYPGDLQGLTDAVAEWLGDRPYHLFIIDVRNDRPVPTSDPRVHYLRHPTPRSDYCWYKTEDWDSPDGIRWEEHIVDFICRHLDADASQPSPVDASMISPQEKGIPPLAPADLSFTPWWQRVGLTEATLAKAPRPTRDLAATGSTPLDAIRRTLWRLAPQPCGYPLRRLGGEGDGAYLVPDCLDTISTCFSPGVNNAKAFEDELTLDHGIACQMCDRSSDPSQFLTPLLPGQVFRPLWLEPESSEESISLADWVDEAAPGSGDFILQMDIEGAEFRNLLTTSADLLNRFRILIIEVHDLGRLADRAFHDQIFAPWVDLLTTNHVCVHAHANNCCGETRLGDDVIVPNAIELTLLRRDFIRADARRLVIPHPLDVMNVASQAPLDLKGLWLRHADLIASGFAAHEHKHRWLEGQISAIQQRFSVTLQRLHHLEWEHARQGWRVLKRLPDLAEGKRADQSSLSEWSTSDDAAGAVSGSHPHAFGFHTQWEPSPWWSVDLGTVCGLSALVVHNRVDMCWERSEQMQVWLSTDAEKWTLFYDHAGRPAFGSDGRPTGLPPLVLALDGQRAQYLKLRCPNTTSLHLCRVCVYGTE